MRKCCIAVIAAVVFVACAHTTDVAHAADDVTLEIVIPGEFVPIGADAFNSVYPGKPAGLPDKVWVERKTRQWIWSVIVKYRNRVIQEAALEAAAYTPYTDADNPLQTSE